MGSARRPCAWASLLWGCLSVVLAQQVTVKHEVTGYLGKRVVLPCNIAVTGPEMKVSQVTWVKEVGGRRQNVAVHHPTHGQSYPMEKNSRRIRFSLNSLTDATLVIEHLLMSDEGTYSCEFATYPNGNEFGTTNLIVLAKPTSGAEAMEVKSSNVEQPVAVCTSANGKPPARITWQSKLNGNSSVKQTNNSDGTVTVTSHYNLIPTKEANEQQITCLVEHVALPQSESFPIHLSILYAPEVAIEGYDDNWYLTRNDATLICNARGNPTPVDFSWTTSNGPLPKSVEVQGQRLLVKKVDYSVNTTFICQATNRVGQVSTQQIILVRDQPVKSQSSNVGALAWGIVGGILALAVVGIIVFFILHRRHPRASKGSFDPKTRVFGNGTAQPPTHDFTELDRPLKPATGRKPEDDEDDDYREEEREERRHPPYGYAPRHREDEEERFDQLGPILRFSPDPHGYDYDDMESQHDGSIISKTAVYV
ncbi:nectin-2 isoform X2 [Ahaetulla prasina]|uniref:nectin-2 isoform X2 n=1 Tax=Ahaetulla prasina TaxID=499056 RepID=UPI002649F97F|nr:nectin-2 isoform X2 [Ahaetulla prasina]